MDAKKLEQELDALVADLESSSDPRDRGIANNIKRVRTNHKTVMDGVDRLRGSIDNLRICIKYLVFDLEATRRENEGLRKQLEDK